MPTQVNLAENVSGVLPTANGGTGSSSIPTWNQNTTGNAATATKIIPRVNSITSSATPAINTDTTDLFEITALAAAITSMTSSMTGTFADGQTLLIRIKDNGTARAITWGANFSSTGLATLLATTVVGKYHYVGLIYNAAASTWDCVACDPVGR